MKSRDTKEYQEFISRTYHYLALISSVFLALYNFGLSLQTVSTLSFIEYSLLFTPFAFGFILYGACFHLQQAIMLKRRFGVFWERGYSHYFASSVELKCDLTPLKFQESFGDLILEEENGVKEEQVSQEVVYEINWEVVWTVAVRAIILGLSQIVYFAIVYASFLAEVNLSVIMNIQQINPFVIAIAYYLSFGEKLRNKHLVGMFLVTICIVINAFSQDLHPDSVDNSSQPISILVPITCSLLYSVLFCALNWITRLFPLKTRMRSQQYVSDSFIIVGVVFLILALAFPQEYQENQKIVIISLSLLLVFSYALIGEAMAYGKGGPAQALIDLNSFWLLLLELAFLQQYPNTLQYIAFAFGLVGGALIALDHH